MSKSDKESQQGAEGNQVPGDLKGLVAKIKALEQFKLVLTTIVVVITAMGAFGLWGLFAWADAEIKGILSDVKMQRIDEAGEEADAIIRRMKEKEQEQEDLSLPQLEAKLRELRDQIPILRIEQGVHTTRAPQDYNGELQHSEQFHYRAHISFEHPFTEPPVVFASLNKLLQEGWSDNPFTVYDLGVGNVDTLGFDYSIECSDVYYWNRSKVAWIAFGK